MTTNNGFDAAKLNQKTPSKKGPRPERLFMEVHAYDTPSDGFHYAVGARFGSGVEGERVRVRLTTVAERAADRPDVNREKIEGQYVKDSNHRDTIADKAKAKIRLISFDEAIKVGVGEDGVTEYRAHWPKVISTEATAEVMSGIAHIKLQDAYEHEGKRVKAKAHVELLQSATMVNSGNVDEALFKALSIRDEQSRARDPFAIVRVFHQGAQAAAVRIYPERETKKVFDQALGGQKEVSVKADAATTIAALMVGKPGFSDFDTQSKDLVRAVIAGIRGDEVPQFVSTDEAVAGKMLNYYYGAKEGHLQVEVVAAEKIDFGVDSGMTYLKDKNRPHLAAYTIEEPAANDTVKRTVGFVETVIGVHRHPDGEPYAVFASPVALWPKNNMTKLAELPMESLPKMQLESDLANVVGNDGVQSEPAAESAPEPAQNAAEVPAEPGLDDRYDDGPGM
jgi:hypothetical protein